jgi:hypothetical protein
MLLYYTFSGFKTSAQVQPHPMLSKVIYCGSSMTVLLSCFLPQIFYSHEQICFMGNVLNYLVSWLTYSYWLFKANLGTMWMSCKAKEEENTARYFVAKRWYFVAFKIDPTKTDSNFPFSSLLKISNNQSTT